MISEIEFDSVSQLVSSVVTRRSAYPLWFRGQSDHQHHLLPKLLRGPERPMDDVYQREARLIARFRERSLPFWPAGYPQQPWEHLFTMQHHGMPTRLLDWTENLLVATYFAASESAGPAKVPGSATNSSGDTGSEGEREPPKPTVWTLDPLGWNAKIPQLSDTGIGILTVADDEAKRWEPSTSTSDRLAKRAKFPVSLYGVHNSTRIVAQRGTFTITGDSWVGLDQLPCDEIDWSSYLSKYVYTGDRENLMDELNYIGFTESMIYPDLNSLSKELTNMEGWR